MRLPAPRLCRWVALGRADDLPPGGVPRGDQLRRRLAALGGDPLEVGVQLAEPRVAWMVKRGENVRLGGLWLKSHRFQRWSELPGPS